MKKLTPLLQLIRPANIVTSCADILVGFAIASFAAHQLNSSIISSLLLLVLSTAGLYAGGVVLNDVCDLEIDKLERPERVIPSGKITKNQALKLGVSLLLTGIIAAFFVNWISGLLAIVIAIFVLTYDALTKNSLWLGPINMGLCRAFNLLLGISIIPDLLRDYWMLFFIHLFYISAVTLISKGEVHGGNKKILSLAFFLYNLTVIGVLLLIFTPNFHLLQSLVFLVVFYYLICSSLFKAIQSLEPLVVRRAVKFGILSLIILDAAIAAGYAGWWYGLFMLLLLPLCLLLGRKFAVT